MAGRLRQYLRERRDSLRELRAATPLTFTATRWELRPQIRPGDEVCLFLTFAAGGYIPAHALHHARGWAAAGFKVVLVVVADDLAAFVPPDDWSFAAGMFVRRNEGYDFGGWAAAIRSLPELRDAERLVTVNDSLYGPLDTFATFVERLRISPADIVGAVDSRELRPHFQSFLLAFGPRALRSRAFWRFWNGVRNGSRKFVIDRYETRLVHRLTAGGLTATALFCSPDGENGNVTLTDHWRDLVRDGFPFIKIRLLRDNPRTADLTGWRALLAERGFDVGLIDAHLGVGH